MSPITATDFCTWTSRDPRLSRVLQYVQCGWPNDGDFKLNCIPHVVLKCRRTKGALCEGREWLSPHLAVLRGLHEGHLGISKMKARVRMCVWWPGMNSDIEKFVRRCQKCQVQSSPPLAPFNPWRWPLRPQARLHLYFAGPFQGNTMLVLIDAPSKVGRSSLYTINFVSRCHQQTSDVH